MSTEVVQTYRSVPPGPRGYLFLGSVRDVARNPAIFYASARRQFGDIVRFRALPWFHWYFIAHPNDIDHVLRANHRNYIKGVFARPLKLMLGEGLVTSDGEHWRRHRRLVHPAFHRRRLTTLGPVISSLTESMLEEWASRYRGGVSFNVADEMMALTFQIVGRALFGADLQAMASQVSSELAEVLDYIDYRSYHVFAPAECVPTPRNRRFLRSRRALDDVVNRLIEGRRRSGDAGHDLLSMLMEARDEGTGQGLSGSELRDEVMTLLLAGHETTSVALSWTWYLLSLHPAVDEKLYEELEIVLGGRLPTVDDLPRLEYTRMVLEESMRLYPPAWGMVRQAVGEDELGGYRIPAGSPVAISQYVTHRHSEFWDEPERFNPDRFLPALASERAQFAYFPFSGGPRSCIGSHLAMMEARLILATVAQRYRLQVVPGHIVTPEPLVTLRPKHGVLVTLEERS